MSWYVALLPEEETMPEVVPGGAGLTVLYLEAPAAETIDAIRETLDRWVHTRRLGGDPRVHATIHGQARFAGEEHDYRVLLVDAPAIRALRYSLEILCHPDPAARGLFTPHITLGPQSRSEFAEFGPMMQQRVVFHRLKLKQTGTDTGNRVWELRR